MLRRVLELLQLSARAEHVMGVNARNRMLIKRYNQRRHYALADDKLRTKEILEAEGVPVPRTLDVFSSLIEAAAAPGRLRQLREFVVKPASGRAGKGILVLVRPAWTTPSTPGPAESRQRQQEVQDLRRLDPMGWFDTGGRFWSTAEVSRWISDILFGNYAHGLTDRALIEERLEPLPLLEDAPLFGLPDLRVLTLRGVPVMGMLRLPTRRSHGKANLHQGAIGVGVDLHQGRMIRATYRGERIESHPDSGAPVVGQVVPRWADVLDVARRAAAALPLGYLGIDVALDVHRGPVILEVNVRPGLEIQNANGRGLRQTLAELDSARASETLPPSAGTTAGPVSSRSESESLLCSETGA